MIATSRARKKLVLCEKPLAVSRTEAADIKRVAEETRTPIIIGTMHVYDPAYRAAQLAWHELADEARLVRSSIYLPSNDVFIDQATDQTTAQAAPQSVKPDPSDPAFQRDMIRAAMLGLAIHNIPLVREFYPSPGILHSARFLPPFGYSLSMSNGAQAARFSALMPGQWQPRWTLQVTGRTSSLRIVFPPSYVLSGSCRAVLASKDSAHVFEQAKSGYEIVWEHIADIVRERAVPSVSLETAVGDLGFALDLAGGAAGKIGEVP